MNIGKACAIFEQIKADKYTEQEKLQAIKEVIAMPTHNGITKDEILTAFRWFFDFAVEESRTKQTNADIVRAMNDKELCRFLERINACGYLEGAGDTAPECEMCERGFCKFDGIHRWLQREVKA